MFLCGTFPARSYETYQASELLPHKAGCEGGARWRKEIRVAWRLEGWEVGRGIQGRGRREMFIGAIIRQSQLLLEKARKQFPWRFKNQNYTHYWIFNIDLGEVLEKWAGDSWLLLQASALILARPVRRRKRRVGDLGHIVGDTCDQSRGN